MNLILKYAAGIIPYSINSEGELSFLLGYEDGKIIVTPHGFLAGKEAAEEKVSIEKYKTEHAEYWKEIIGTDGDFDLKEEKEDS
jgi:hypothetical protein